MAASKVKGAEARGLGDGKAVRVAGAAHEDITGLVGFLGTFADLRQRKIIP